MVGGLRSVRDLEELEGAGAREEDRTDEERHTIDADADERHVAGKGPDRKARGSDHEQDGDPPRPRVPGAGHAFAETPALAVRAGIPLPLDAVEFVDRVRDERPWATDGDGAGALGEPAPPFVVTPQWWNPDEFEASLTGEG